MIDDDLKGRVVELLRRRHSAWPITKGEAASRLYITTREFEHTVYALRQQLHPIVSDTGGYWFTDDPTELENFAGRLDDRLKHQYRTIKAARRTAERMRLERSRDEKGQRLMFA